MKTKRLILIALGLVAVLLVLWSVQAGSALTTLLSGGSSKESVPMVEKVRPQVSVSLDKDKHGIEILARHLKNVKKVEMLVGYEYKGRANPPLLASGAPQQDSYWAHFRFESCSRGECLFYPVKDADFTLTLSYADGESLDFKAPIIFSQISQDTPLNF